MPNTKKFNLRRLITLLPPLIGLSLLIIGSSTVHAGGTIWSNSSQNVIAVNSWNGITYGNSKFVAVASGANTKAMYSTNGTTWTAGTSAPNNSWTSVTYGSPVISGTSTPTFVAVASSGTSTRVMTSLNGIAWTGRTSAADSGWTSVTYGNGLFVAVANSATTGNYVMTSPNGTTWTSRASPANQWNSVTYGNGTFVAVANLGTGNRVMTSTNGIDWTTQTSSIDNNWTAVTYGTPLVNGTATPLFVAVANSGAGNRVMTSPDGSTWTTQTTSVDAGWKAITFGNSIYVAVANANTGAISNRVMSSADGINWTIQPSNFNKPWDSIATGLGKYVAVSAVSSTAVSLAMSSSIYDIPTVTSVSPTYGITPGGTRTLISGTDFTVDGTGTSVTFDGIAATNVTVLTPTSLYATTPADGAGTVDIVVTTPGGSSASGNQMFIYGNCGAGLDVEPGVNGIGVPWVMLSLPCVPARPTVSGVLGTNSITALLDSNYGINETGVDPVDKIGWIIETRDVLGAASTAIPSLERLLISSPMNVGTGYWYKSYIAANGLKLIMDQDSTPTITDTDVAHGCYSSFGCKAIRVGVNNGSSNRYNMVGNPFPYNVDWSQVRIRVDGNSATLTPAAAEAAGWLQDSINIWNGNTYDATNSTTALASYTSPTSLSLSPNLLYFQSFWVNVYKKSFGHTIELLIPALPSTYSFNQSLPAKLESVATVAMPWYLAWLDFVVPPAVADQAPTVKQKPLANAADWSIRLKVNNPVTGWKDHNNALGQFSDALIGYDRYDIVKMAPFSTPYLSLVFPHSGWGANAGDYATDFHPNSLKEQTWTFEVRAMPVGSKVFLSWKGSPALLKRSQLIEVATGKIIVPSDPLWAKKGYPLTLNAPAQSYIWKVSAP